MAKRLSETDPKAYKKWLKDMQKQAEKEQSETTEEQTETATTE